MKINKRIAIPLLSTVLGLALVGGIGGAVAWYQYNTRVNASFVGSSVAESGVLQISSDGTNWKRDVYVDDADHLAPVTFGASSVDQVMGKNDQLPQIGSAARGTVAYAYPEAGKGPYEQWQTVTQGREFIQYTIYLKALAVDPSSEASTASEQTKQVSKDVFLSDLIMEGVTENKTDVGDALRLHLEVSEHPTSGSDVYKKSFLISNNGQTVDLYGAMDLDGVEGNDKKGGMSWDTDKNQEVVYGRSGATQQTYAIADLKTDRKDGDFDFDDATDRANRLICTTPLTGSTKIVVTAWLEGWQTYGTGAAKSAVWKPAQTAGTATNPVQVHVGMTFDVGRDVFKS